MKSERIDMMQLTLCFISKEVIDLLCGSVEGDDSKALVVHVQNQILALLKSSALNTRDLICC